MNLPSNNELKGAILYTIASNAFRSGQDEEDLAASHQLRNAFEALMEKLHAADAVPKDSLARFRQVARDGAAPAQLRPMAMQFAHAMSDEDFSEALAQSGLFMAAVGHKKFMEASEGLEALRAIYGEEARRMPAYRAWVRQAMEYAPPELQEAAWAKAQELGLLPQARLVDDAGCPVFSAHQIAKVFGIPDEDVPRFVAEHGDLFEVAGNVHTLQ